MVGKINFQCKSYLPNIDNIKIASMWISIKIAHLFLLFQAKTICSHQCKHSHTYNYFKQITQIFNTYWRSHGTL